MFNQLLDHSEVQHKSLFKLHAIQVHSYPRVNKGQTIFLFLSSLKASGARSFFGKSFALGMTLDMRVNTFRTGAGGFTSSAILAATYS